ncbi:hypothetical protein, partial [Halorubrum sp. SP9]|uniref:hypothetical protein n=1 Tax=Halorubrum sp. SP9 TaxID=1537267 RepID=UPI0010F91D67
MRRFELTGWPDQSHRMITAGFRVRNFSFDSERVLSVGWDHHDLATALDEAAVRDVLERAAGLLAAALDRISSQTRDPTSEIDSEIRIGAFQQAIEDAADGVAILDDEAYVYI